MYEEEESPTGMVPKRRSGLVPSWLGRISWGSVIAGMAIAISVQSILTAIGVLVALGTTTVNSIAALSGVGLGVGIWTLFSVLISYFAGSYATARLANAKYSGDGLWHGLTVWALTVATGVLLGTIMVSLALILGGITSSALTAVSDVNVTIIPSDIQAAVNIVIRIIEFMLLAWLLGLATSLLGGWAGSDRVSREETYVREGTRRTRRTA